MIFKSLQSILCNILGVDVSLSCFFCSMWSFPAWFNPIFWELVQNKSMTSPWHVLDVSRIYTVAAIFGQVLKGQVKLSQMVCFRGLFKIKEFMRWHIFWNLSHIICLATFHFTKLQVFYNSSIQIGVSQRIIYFNLTAEQIARHQRLE